MKKKLVIIGLIGCLTLANVSIAMGAKNIEEEEKPIASTETEVAKGLEVETKTILVDNEGVITDIKIPVIKGLKDANCQEQINQIIESTTQKDLEEFKEAAKELEELDIAWVPEMLVNYEVKSDKDVLSIVITSYFYTGGANGMSRRDYYNIDINENKAFQLNDLFKENSDYKTIINNEIKNQIEEQVASGEKAYFEGEEGFITIKDAQNFYIDENGDLIIAFALYEIAPRCSGFPEFKIPNNSIAHILKNTKPIIENDKCYEIKNFDKLTINGNEVKLNKPMFKSDKGTVMMPLAKVARELGFNVNWDGKNKVANINKEAISAGAYTSEHKYYYSKAFVYLEEEAKLIKGTTFVPISFVDQVLKGERTVNEEGILNIKY